MALPIVDLVNAARQCNDDNAGKAAMTELFKHAHEQIQRAMREGGEGVDFPCPLCGGQLHLIRGEDFYGKDYSRDGQGGTHRWVCGNWPDCDAHVGCHGRTYVPLGTPAGYGLRILRQRCHAAFDRMWQSGIFKRREAYGWLAGKLGIDGRDCHIGQFDNDLCKRALSVLGEFWEVEVNVEVKEDGSEKLVYGTGGYVR